jgi:hypothetical protein
MIAEEVCRGASKTGMRKSQSQIQYPLPYWRWCISRFSSREGGARNRQVVSRPAPGLAEDWMTSPGPQKHAIHAKETSPFGLLGWHPAIGDPSNNATLFLQMESGFAGHCGETAGHFPGFPGTARQRQPAQSSQVERISDFVSLPARRSLFSRSRSSPLQQACDGSVALPAFARSLHLQRHLARRLRAPPAWLPLCHFPVSTARPHRIDHDSKQRHAQTGLV